MHHPGIEPRANAWKAFMLPLHQWCLLLTNGPHQQIEFLIRIQVRPSPVEIKRRERPSFTFFRSNDPNKQSFSSFINTRVASTLSLAEQTSMRVVVHHHASRKTSDQRELAPPRQHQLHQVQELPMAQIARLL